MPTVPRKKKFMKGNSLDSPHKRRRMNPSNNDDSETVEGNPHLLHLFHSSGVGPGGEGLPTRESTEATRKNEKTNTNKMEDGDSDEEGLIVEEETGKGDLKRPAVKAKEGKTMEGLAALEKVKGGESMVQDVEMESGDDVQDDGGSRATTNTESDLKVGDNFFTREPFSMKELVVVEDSCKEQMEKSVSLLEREGYGVFKEWRSKAQTRKVAVKEERKQFEQALKDAKIMGSPRQYQRRLFEIACKQNTIIHLGTGAGKTLISLMLIRHLAKDYEKGKQTLFLVPSVALAIQQSTVLRSNLPYSVQVACYTTSPTPKARKALQECNILVATHGAIIDLLSHYKDAFSMENFNLLCMDECHYAIGNHAYATLMKRFFHTLPEEARPRVLGLTASPLVRVRAGHTNENLAHMLKTLEGTLTATVVSHLTGMDAEQPVPIIQQTLAEEKDILYAKNFPSQCLPSFNSFKLHYTRERELVQLEILYSDLGPLAMSIYCQTLAKEVSRNSFERESQLQFNSLVSYFHHVARFCDKLSQACSNGGRSDKLLALEQLMEDVIEENGGSDTVVLIFVERRITAMALNDYFKFRLKATAQDNWIRASEVRESQPKLRSNSSSPVNSPGRRSRSSSVSNSSASSSARSSPSVEIMEASPASSMDQFADAESDVEMEISTTVTVEKQEEVNTQNEVCKPSNGNPGSQFDDASDEESESQGAIQQYMQGVRGEQSEGKTQVQSADEAADDFAFGKPFQGICLDTKTDPFIDFQGNEVDGELDCEVWNLLDQFDDVESRESTDSPPLDTGANSGKETIRCQALVRNSTHIFKSLNISRKLNKHELTSSAQEEWLHTESKIREVLAGLRRGDINVLIATSVVEEGVDVQACNCVVAFDSLRSAKGYIQMRGRARAKDAKFFVFKDIKDRNTTLTLDSAQEIEKRVAKFIAARSSKAEVEYSPIESTKEPLPPCKSDCAEIRAVEAGTYEAKSGSVDLHQAKSLVNRYVLSLPIDPRSRGNKAALAAHLPTYSSRELYLPSHLPSRVRRIRLPSAYYDLGRKEKEKILSMMAVVRLHSHGLLSERLLPLTRKDMQELILKRAIQDPRDIPVKSLGSFGQNGTKKRKIFMYPFEQKNGRIDKLHKILRSKGHSLAILSTEKLPSIPSMRVAHSGFGSVSCSIGAVVLVECTEGEFDIVLRFFKLIMDSRWRRRTKDVFFRPKSFEQQSSMIPPYFVACLSAAGKLDFKQMAKLISESKRSEDKRIEAVRSASDDVGLREPRLWAPLYDKNFTYISYGPSGLACNSDFPTDCPRERAKTKTYKDYFQQCRDYEVKDSCLLFDAQRLWALPFSKASTKAEESDQFQPKKVAPSVHSTNHKICKDLKSLLLPKDACMEIPMADPNFLLLATHLPQFLNHMQGYLTAHAFTEHCHKHMPRLADCLLHLSAEQVTEVLTAKSCAEEESYDKLEWLGDAVLKLVQTDSLMHSRDFAQWIEFLHEGDLSMLRSVMGCNDRLAVACKKLKVDHFLLTAPFGRGQWSPATLELYSPATAGCDNGEGAALTEEISGKTCADVIEAILGVVYLERGYAEATSIADELEVSLPQVNDKTPPDRKIAPKSRLLRVASSFTGHSRFRRPDLVQEAFTHPTAMHPETPSYQRLEWVGDAVLCLAVREWIYKNFHSIEVGQMVSMEASLVSNETLSFLAIKQELLQHLDHCDQSLPARIEYQLWLTQELRRGLWATDPPKVAADVVEALLGAVYMDSGFASGVSAVSKILSPLYRCIRQIYSNDKKVVTMHPKKAFQEIGGSLLALNVKREEEYAATNPANRLWLGKRWGTARPDSNHFVATVECLGLDVVSIVDVSSEVAGNRACAFAVAMLQRDPNLLKRLQAVRSMVESSSSKEKKQTQAEGADAMDVSESSISTKASGNAIVSKNKKQGDAVDPVEVVKLGSGSSTTPKKKNQVQEDAKMTDVSNGSSKTSRSRRGQPRKKQSPEQMIISVPLDDAAKISKSVAESVLKD